MSGDKLGSFSTKSGGAPAAIIGALGDAARQAIADWSQKVVGSLPDFGPINNLIVGGKDADVLNATAEGDMVLGRGGDDQLGSAFNRTALFGGQGNDTLTTNAAVPFPAPGGDPAAKGRAFQFGGDGNDTLSATVSLTGDSRTSPATTGRPLPTDTVSILLDGGSGDDTIRAEARIDGVDFSNVELRTNILGGSGNDRIDAIADATRSGILGSNDVANVIDGGAGDDHITALAQTELVAFSGTASNVVKGGDGNDFIEASAIARSLSNKLASNVLDGGSGNDVLHAKTVISSNMSLAEIATDLRGGEGDDELVAVNSSRPIASMSLTETNHLDGGTGRDVLSLDTKSEAASANVHNLLEGGAGEDVITAKLDTVVSGSFGGGGGGQLYDLSNLLKGGTNDDILDGSLTVRLLTGGGATSHGENRLYGGQGNDQLTAFAKLTVDSGADATKYLPLSNYLDGGAGNDILNATIADGTRGASVLRGGAGDDVLTVFGGQGNLLKGGAGKDTLIGGTGSDVMDGGADSDVLVFAPSNGHDTAVFKSGEDLFDLKALAANNIHAFADLNIEVAGGNSIIHFDADNDITVLRNTGLSGSDFLFA